jgi:tetratricopeptide (TPR) repeat protein
MNWGVKMAGSDAPGHLSEDLIERFFQGELDPPDRARVVRHLLTRCTQCLELAATAMARVGFGPWLEDGAALEEAVAPTTYSTVFLQLMESRHGEDILRLGRERIQGIGLLAELERMPPSERATAVQAKRRFHHWGLFDRLLTTYLDYSRNDPRSGVELVEVALVVLGTLSATRYSRSLLADFRAAALGALGNAKRLAGRFDEARQALAEAWEALENGSGDPLEEAQLLSLEASLERDLGAFERSSHLLDRALEIYRDVGDNNAQAKTLIQQANALGYIEPRRGVELLNDALRLLDAAEEPRLELCARHTLALFLNEAGEPTEALAVVEVTRPLYRSFGDYWTQLRLRWLEGRIARAFGDIAEAEAVFRKLLSAFEERGMHYEQTVVAIDLAETLSAGGKFAMAVNLVREFLPVLRSWGMHSEGLAMWLLFEKALTEHARMNVAAGAEAFKAVASYFHRSWRSPLHFEEDKPS